jgi:hypothetical protein
MSGLRKVGDIEVAQDLTFQRREWKIQRVARYIMLLLAMVALAGGFGDGVLASARRQTPAGEIELRYDRITRHHSQSKLEIDLPQRASAEVALWLLANYVDGLEVIDIVPQPDRVVIGTSRITYHFKSAQSPRITFVLKPVDFWRRQGAVGLENGPVLQFTQFVLP